MRHHHIQGRVRNEVITVNHQETQLLQVDSLTKSLTREIYNGHWSNLRVATAIRTYHR
eukprot:IDg11938t1